MARRWKEEIATSQRALLAMTERKLQQRAFLTDKKTGINSSYLPAGDPGYRSKGDLARETVKT
jgi:hypothetical protein